MVVQLSKEEEQMTVIILDPENSMTVVQISMDEKMKSLEQVNSENASELEALRTTNKMLSEQTGENDISGPFRVRFQVTWSICIDHK